MTEHRVRIATDAVEHWVCTCDGWEFRCDYVMDFTEHRLASELHDAHVARAGQVATPTAEAPAPAPSSVWLEGNPRVFERLTWLYEVGGDRRGWVQHSDDFAAWDANVRPLHGQWGTATRHDTLEEAQQWVADMLGARS